MPQAVTHFLIPVMLLELFRDLFVKDRKKFPVHYVFIGGLAGMLPDLDFAVYYILSFFGFTIHEVHRTFSHNLFVPLIFIVLAILFHKFKNKELGRHHLKLSIVFGVIAFGILTHLIMDWLFIDTIMLFYPFSTARFGLNLILLAPNAWQGILLPTIDAGLLIFWMVYLEWKHRISDLL